MLPTILLERLQLLLNSAKDPRLNLFAPENLAAAKELIDTAFTLGAINREDHMAYRAMCTSAQLMVSSAEVEKVIASLPKAEVNIFDGIRTVRAPGESMTNDNDESNDYPQFAHSKERVTCKRCLKIIEEWSKP